MITTQNILDLFLETRARTESICKPLEIEDYVVQPHPDISPPKWHLGHSSWFYEEFILKLHKPNYQLFHQDFAYVFNSYYNHVGERVVRANRGSLSRPGVTQVYDYRHYITNEIKELIELGLPEGLDEVLLIGIHHEKQHQELLITDIKYILGNNPLTPLYNESFEENKPETIDQNWIHLDSGIYDIGHDGIGFSYDNELGRHQVYLEDFQISNKHVTNQEYVAFIESGGYQDFNHWHADGLEWLNKQQIKQPRYWHKIDDQWHQYTLAGLKPLQLDAAVSHISYYEAFAFAQWKGCRLPTEFEWEAANEHFKWGQRWEWTESAYLPYPRYKKAAGALGEYNGKFMVNQKVLRGGSVATAPKHTRKSYRNFFAPDQRWQFTGIRLAK